MSEPRTCPRCHETATDFGPERFGSFGLLTCWRCQSMPCRDCGTVLPRRELSEFNCYCPSCEEKAQALRAVERVAQEAARAAQEAEEAAREAERLARFDSDWNPHEERAGFARQYRVEWLREGDTRTRKTRKTYQRWPAACRKALSIDEEVEKPRHHYSARHKRMLPGTPVVAGSVRILVEYVVREPEVDPERLVDCACGCGTRFVPYRASHRFAGQAHRQRAWELSQEAAEELERPTSRDASTVRAASDDDASAPDASTVRVGV